MSSPSHTGRLDIDLEAIRSNVASLRRHAPTAALMSVLKADAYGHGAREVARAAIAGGATWLGAAQLPEALALRQHVPASTRVFSWLFTPGTVLDDVLAAGIDVAASAPWALESIADAARATGVTARVHLKIDTGLARSGAAPSDWPALVEAAIRLRDQGLIEATGIWSHLVAADEPGHPSILDQRAVFETAVAQAADLGWRPEVRHLANSAAVLGEPDLHYDLVRPGLACYGLTPLPQLGDPSRFGLTPAMTLSTRLALVKQVDAGQGVSYGHTYVTETPTTLGLVPLGYADGVPRHASSRGEVSVGGRRVPIVGRICMDQFVVDLGPDATEQAGDDVVVFGVGGPSAQHWAEAAETISYEIVTRMSDRLPRQYQQVGEGR